MSEENAEQSFEDAFEELTGGVPPAEAPESNSPEETGDADVPLREGQEKEEEETKGQVGEEPGNDASSELAALRQELQKERHKYNSDLGRQNAYQRQLKERDEEIARLRSSQAANPGISDDRWKTVKEDYPDIAEGMTALVEQTKQAHAEEVAALKQQLEPIQGQLHENYVQQQYSMLAAEHPDWEKIAASPEFNHWISTQPHNVRQMMESEQAGDAAYLLRVWKNENAPAIQPGNSELKQRREKQLRQAQNVPSRGGRSQQVVPPESDFNAAFDYFVEQDERR
tara:strand:+ start:340 stop:1191 length:852 start_codon:yes stop_codon:yes gene_type:complete